MTEFAVGDRVTVNPNISCGLCHACRSGPLLCRQLRGIGTNNPGGFAEHVTAPVAATYDAAGLDDATGAPSVTETTVGLTRDGGTVMFYGVAGPDDRVSLSSYDIIRREITIKGSFAEISAFPAALEALRGGRVKTTGLITHGFGLDDSALALEALRSDRTAHKIVLIP